MTKKTINIVLVMIVFCLVFSSLVCAQDKDSTSSKPDSSQTKVDSTGSRKLSFDGYPYAYYTPETELAVGVGGIFIFYGSVYFFMFFRI